MEEEEDSLTFDLQSEMEAAVFDCLSSEMENMPDHTLYVLNALNGLPGHFVSLDASKPWLCYWNIHSLSLLNFPIDDDLIDGVLSTISNCWSDAEGGYGGGPYQLAHLAPTYAAVNAILSMYDGTNVHVLQRIDRPALLKFLRSQKTSSGAFHMHRNGEVDVRGIYCAISIASVLNLDNWEDSLGRGVAEFIQNCQTYEGGISGFPGGEAHGGYTFCAVATLVILNKLEVINISRLWKWLVKRQMSVEGGFQGRTNKLVDGCYSFWIGAVFALLSSYPLSCRHQKTAVSPPSTLFNEFALSDYILKAATCQRGGLTDRPYNGPDYYHLCYGLSGLSLAQHHVQVDPSQFENFRRQAGANIQDDDFMKGSDGVGCWLPEHNDIQCPLYLLPVHPVYNIRLDRCVKALQYFYKIASS